MDQENRTLSFVRRRAWLIGLLSVGCLCLSIILAYTITPTYRAEGRLLIEQGDISTDIVETTVRGFAEERIELVRKRVMTREHVMEMIGEHELYFDLDLRDTLKARLFRDSSSVFVEELDDGTMSFIVAFEDEDRFVATDVVTSLMALFQEENVKSRTESAVNTAAFLENEAARLSVEIADYEDRIAEYKQLNSGRLPEQEGMNMQFLDRVERELEAVEREIRELAQRRAVAEADLMRVRASVGAGGAVEPPPGSPERLRYLQAEYMRLLSTYSSEHPNVKKLQREIQLIDPNAPLLSVPVIAEQIRSKTAEIADLRNRYSADHPNVMAAERSLSRLQQEMNSARSGAQASSNTDPESARLLAIVNGIDREAAAQRVRRDELRLRINSYEDRLTNAPQVQREYLGLTRGYDQLRQKYDDVKLKQTQTELAVSVEEGQRGGRFALTSPAQTPDSPFNPNRPALIFLGLLLGVGSGLLVSAALEATDKTLRDEADVREVWEAPPLVAIPLIRNQADNRSRHIKIGTYVLVMLVMITGAVISVLGSS